jgi:hypothetical protein
MELIWILTGGDFDNNIGEIKHYNLIEYDNLENIIRISKFFKRKYKINTENSNDLDNLLPEINKELDNGIKFLCKTDIYYNGNTLFYFGYYSKINDEYVYTKIPCVKNKIFYKKFIKLLIDNCVTDLP